MKKYVGITACPTGIAHTYMAAEKLEETAKETGNQIKVETQGSIGVENELTADDIREADAVVVAADTEVDLSRFDGKRVLVTGVQDGISRPAELLEQALTAPTRGALGLPNLPTSQPPKRELPRPVRMARSPLVTPCTPPSWLACPT